MESSFTNIAYVHDGSLEGLLTGVFESYERRDDPEDLVAETEYEPRLGQFSHVVITDFSKADRVRRGVVRAAGPSAFNAILRASTCEGRSTGMVVLRFIQHAMAREKTAQSAPILDELANPVVSDLVDLVRRANNECERVRQFARFSQLSNGIWFARISPQASVVPLVMGYFADRFNIQPFIVYDERHRLAGVYDGRTWELVRGEAANVPLATSQDAVIQQAWKRFYDAVSIDTRYNPELRRHFIPSRFWANLTELQPAGSALAVS